MLWLPLLGASFASNEQIILQRDRHHDNLDASRDGVDLCYAVARLVLYRNCRRGSHTDTYNRSPVNGRRAPSPDGPSCPPFLVGSCGPSDVLQWPSSHAEADYCGKANVRDCD